MTEMTSSFQGLGEEVDRLSDAQKVALCIQLAERIVDVDCVFQLRRLSAAALETSDTLLRDAFERDCG